MEMAVGAVVWLLAGDVLGGKHTAERGSRTTSDVPLWI